MVIENSEDGVQAAQSPEGQPELGIGLNSGNHHNFLILSLGLSTIGAVRIRDLGFSGILES